MESQEIPRDEKIRITHSISLVREKRSPSSTREKEGERGRKTTEGERARLRAYERGRVGFRENSCRSFEASSLVRASHLAESESPGRPCSDAQVHAGQDSPFASLTSSLSLSPSLLPSSTIATTITTTVVIIIGATLGRAEHLLLRRRASLDPSPHRAVPPTFPLERHGAEDST